MCGIVGASANRNVIPILLQGLKHLEYRGYDSAGLAILDTRGHIERRRVVGKVDKLVENIEENPLTASLGIAHTRWATHGAPHEYNAHPHLSQDQIALVHNGIIENADSCRAQLQEAGYTFSSQTDTEVIVHLLHFFYQMHKNFAQAIQQISEELSGAYSLAIINTDFPDQVWGLRKGCPLVVGVGIEENFLASDKLALLPVTQKFISLKEGDIVCIDRTHIKIWDSTQKLVERNINETEFTQEMITKAGYRHFMLKEIFEQPEVIQNLLEQSFFHHHLRDNPLGGKIQHILLQAKQIVIVACGTSYLAGLTAKYWLESIAQIPCQVEIASEFRYRDPVVNEGSIFISISQSGETADTLAALRLAKQLNFNAYIAICNVAESTLANESDAVILLHAGPEIGVASTKAFIAQLYVLLIITLLLAKHHHKNISVLEEAIIKLPQFMQEILQLDKCLKNLAQQFIHRTNALFLGRGVNYPIALEGALKLKELSYIHAEAYPAGELKHGPLALVDHEMPIILLAPNNALFEKVHSNAQEVKARNGFLIIVTDKPEAFSHLGEVITMPSVPPILEPFIYVLPLQLFAYHVAVLKGTDVDQPRNLAKSVTVE